MTEAEGIELAEAWKQATRHTKHLDPGHTADAHDHPLSGPAPEEEAPAIVTTRAASTRGLVGAGDDASNRTRFSTLPWGSDALRPVSPKRPIPHGTRKKIDVLSAGFHIWQEAIDPGQTARHPQRAACRGRRTARRLLCWVARE